MTERSAVPPEEPGGSPRTDPRQTAPGGRPISRKSLLRAAVAAGVGLALRFGRGLETQPQELVAESVAHACGTSYQ